MSRKSASGFTIIEMLVVITITVLLMGLIFYPIVRSFNLTHQAQVMTQAQDTARQTLEQIQRELSQAMFVYDNSHSTMTFYLTPDPSDLSQPRGFPVQLTNAKVDFVLPKLMMHCNNFSSTHPASAPRDYERGDEAWPSCPYCNSDDVEARPIQPLRQDTKVVRYFIGLLDNDPKWPYINSYTMEGLPPTIPGPPSIPIKENPYVLYRAEFSINDVAPDPVEIDSFDLFPQGMSVEERLNWPDFFYSEETGADGNPIWANWKKIAQVVGPSEDVDMAVQVMGTPVTLIPAVKFTPAGVDNDTLTPTYLTDRSAETPNAIPTVFRATHGHWAPNYKIVVYNNDYTDWFYTGIVPSTGHLWVHNKDGVEVFDITQYRIDRSFTGSLDLMFDIDPNKGEVSFAFPSSDTLSVQAIEDAYARQYKDSLDTAGIGVAERTAFIGGAVASIRNAKIIPGTEQVVGPDMTPGPSYASRMVRYERVPLALGDPGLNQYKIDYDYKAASGENPPSTARIWFTSDPNTPMPVEDRAGNPFNIEITYQFHNNSPNQIVKADYDTKNLITLSLAIRLFDSTSGKPMVVELSDQVKVRNIAR